MRTLLIAIGNSLRGDDGVAWRLAESAPSAWTTEFVVQLTPEWAAAITGYQRVIFADASVECVEPMLRAVGTSEDSPAFSHDTTPECVVHLARQLFGFAGEAWTCHIPAYSFDTPEVLTEDCALGLQRAKDLLWSAARQTDSRDDQ